MGADEYVGCELGVELSGYPSSIGPGETLSFAAAANNSCHVDLTLDQALLVVSGPAGITVTLYDGDGVNLTPGAKVQAPVGLYVPPKAPEGTYQIAVEIYREGQLLDDEAFSLEVSDATEVRDTFDFGEDTSSHDYQESGDCTAGVYRCDTDSRRIGVCGDGESWAQFTAEVKPGSDDVTISSRVPWSSGPGALIVDGQRRGSLTSDGCEWIDVELSGMSGDTADGELDIRIVDESSGCTGDLQISYMEVVSN